MAQLRQMQGMMNGSSQARQLQVTQAIAALAPAAIQRYAVADGGGKISANSTLLVRNAETAYAVPDKFGAANGIAGQVQFNQGAAAAEPYQALREIVPVAREGSDLARDTAAFDLPGQEAGIKAYARNNYYPTAENLTGMLLDILRTDYGDDWEEADEVGQMFGTNDAYEVEQMIDQWTEMVAELLPLVGNYSESGVEQRVDQYMHQQALKSHRPLMPSDCGIMARTISGPGDGSENPIVASGNKYAKNSAVGGHAEWNEHFAAIIMTDGADHITMENAGAKKSDKFGKAQFDRTWFFEMYGDAQGQSFADKYDEDLGH
jgi:hypothetical protein